MSENSLEKRKNDHLSFASMCQTGFQCDPRFFYEPLLAPHPDKNYDLSLTFLGKKLQAPFWISSITGGGKTTAIINQRLALAANKFGIGMGVGSCRPLLEESERYEQDFNLRHYVGDGLPLYGNLGIAQVEDLLLKKEIKKIEDLVSRYCYDGLIIHVNPIQEWIQPEGDRFKRPPLETIEHFVRESGIKIIVKEVGQGFGPSSLEALLKLPIAAIEFGAKGGTNFAKIEEIRAGSVGENPLSSVGHFAGEMVDILAKLLDRLGDKVLCQEFIISGGITSAVDGHYYQQLLNKSSVIGFAYLMANAAKSSSEELERFISNQLDLLKMARSYLVVR